MMNLSQDEIAALMAEAGSGDAPAQPAADAGGGGDNMSPEAIAAMLADAESGADAGAPAAAEAEASDVDIMSPEAIAAMLAEAESAPPAEDSAPAAAQPAADAGGGGDNMSPEAIAAMLADAEGTGGAADSGAAPAEDTPVSMQDAFSAAKPIEGALTDQEADILGEVGNISMGAVATTMYSLLDRRVSITTPRVSVYESKDVLSVYAIPFVVATIEYTQGIEGTNLLVLKIEDAAMITDILMGGEGVVEEPIELNEMHLSAMSEIMNQMMGASSTSLAKLLGKPIDIAPPNSTAVDAGFDVASLLGNMDKVTKISFDMEIEGLLKSELIQLMPYDISRTFAKQFMNVESVAEAAGITKSAPPPPPAAAPAPPPPAAAPAPAPAPAPAAAAPPPPPAAAPVPPPAAAPVPPPMEAPPAAAPYPPAAAYDPYGQQVPQGYPPPYQQPMPYPPMQGYGAPPPPMPMAGQGRVVDVQSAAFQSFDSPGVTAETGNIGLVYNIPLQVSVELGKTKKEISEILEFSLGTIIVLDKTAGDPVEIIVNGKLLARGEVVVIDDNYGVRITDIING